MSQADDFIAAQNGGGRSRSMADDFIDEQSSRVSAAVSPRQSEFAEPYKGPSILTQSLMAAGPADKGAAIIAGLDWLGRKGEDYFGGRAAESKTEAERYPVTSIKRPVNRLSQVLESAAQILASTPRIPESIIAANSPESQTTIGEVARGFDPRANVVAYPSLLHELIAETGSAISGKDLTGAHDPMVRPLTNILTAALYGNANPYAPTAEESMTLGKEQFGDAPGNLIMTPAIAEGTFRMIPRSLRSFPVSALDRALGTPEAINGPAMADRFVRAQETTAEIVDAPRESGGHSTTLRPSQRGEGSADGQAGSLPRTEGPTLDFVDGVDPQVAEIATRSLARDPRLYDELLQLGHDPKAIVKMSPEEVAYYVSGGRIDYRKQGFVPKEEVANAVEAAQGSEAGVAESSGAGRIAGVRGEGSGAVELQAAKPTPEEMAAKVSERISAAKSKAEEAGAPSDLTDRLEVGDPHAEAELASAEVDPVTAAKVANRAARDNEVWQYINSDVPIENAPESHPPAKGTAAARQGGIGRTKQVASKTSIEGGTVFKLNLETRAVVEALGETAGRQTGKGKAALTRMEKEAPFWVGKGHNMSLLRILFTKAERGEALSKPQMTMLRGAIDDYVNWRKEKIDALSKGEGERPAKQQVRAKATKSTTPKNRRVFLVKEANKWLVESLSAAAQEGTGWMIGRPIFKDVAKTSEPEIATFTRESKTKGDAPFWYNKGYDFALLRQAFKKAEKGEPLTDRQYQHLRSGIKDFIRWQREQQGRVRQPEVDPSGIGWQAVPFVLTVASPAVLQAVLNAMPGDDDNKKAMSVMRAGGEGLLSAALIGMALSPFREGGGGAREVGIPGRRARGAGVEGLRTPRVTEKAKPLELREMKQEALVEKAMRKRRLAREAKLKSGQAQPEAIPPGFLIESGPDQIATNVHEMAIDGVLPDRELHGNVQRFPELVKRAAFEKLKDILPLAKGFQDIYRSGEKVFGPQWEQVMRPFDEGKGRFVDEFKQRMDRLETEVTKGLGIRKGSRMSAAVQLYGEGLRTSKYLEDTFGIERAERIKRAERWFRSEYDNLIAEVNTALKQIYPTTWEQHQIPYRKDYFHHFKEMEGDVAGILNAIKTPLAIDPQLVAISEHTTPKSTWWGAMQRRVLSQSGKVDAVGGYLNYLPSALYKKHIDPQLDVFNHLVRDLAVATGHGYEIWDVRKDAAVAKFGSLRESQKAVERLAGEYKLKRNEGQTTYVGKNGEFKIVEKPGGRSINNFLYQLSQWTGDLAGKTNFIDRGPMELIGRRSMRVISVINRRIARNAILMNAASSIVQVANLPLAIGEMKQYSIMGVGRTLDMIRTRDLGPQKQSTFLKERYLGNRLRRFDQSVIDQPIKFAASLMNIGDEMATRFMWNGFYEKALHTGERNPVRYADIWTRKMVAGRGIGEMPLVHKSQMGRLFMPFQVEVGNQWLAMKEMGQRRAFGTFATAMIASYAMNEGFQKVIGRRVLFDPIEAAFDAWKIGQVRNMSWRMKALKMAGRGAGEVLSNLPGGMTISAMAVNNNISPTIFGNQDPSRYGSFGSPVLSTLQRAVGETYRFAKGGPIPHDFLYSVVPPYGGAQLRRSVEGLGAVVSGRSRTQAGKYQFSIQDDPINLFRAALFGKYATPEGQKYLERQREKTNRAGR